MKRRLAALVTTGGIAVTGAVPAFAFPNPCTPELFPGTTVVGTSRSDFLDPIDLVDCFLFPALNPGDTFSFLFKGEGSNDLLLTADVYDGLSALHLGGPATFELNINTATIPGLVPASGELVTRIGFASAPPSNAIPEGYSVTLTTRPSSTIPEPASIALFGVGLAGLGLSRRSRKRQAH